MPCWRSIDFDQIKGTSGSKAMEGTNHFKFLLRMIHFRQSTNLRVSFELFQCGLKSQSEYKGDRLFAFCLQRAYDRTDSKSRSMSGSENVYIFNLKFFWTHSSNCHMSSKVMILTLLKAILTVNLFLLSIFFPIQITVTIPMQESKIEPSLLKRPPSHKLKSGQ